MCEYQLEKSLLGLPLKIAVLFDAQNVHVPFFEGVIAKAKSMGDVDVYVFAPTGKSTEKVNPVVWDERMCLVPVKVRKPGDQSVDKKVFQWIGRIEGVGKMNVIVVASTDRGYLRSKEDVRSENRALIAFGHGRLGKKFQKRYDLYYDLAEKQYQMLGDRWTPTERLELLILLRIGMSQSYKFKGWSLLRDVEDFLDRFNPNWRSITGCDSAIELAESLDRFAFKGRGSSEEWISELYL